MRDIVLTSRNQIYEKQQARLWDDVQIQLENHAIEGI